MSPFVAVRVLSIIVSNHPQQMRRPLLLFYSTLIGRQIGATGGKSINRHGPQKNLLQNYYFISITIIIVVLPNEHRQKSHSSSLE